MKTIFPTNQVHCADCMKILPLLSAGSVNSIITDPPYGIDYQSNRRVITKRSDKIVGDAAVCDNGFLSECYRVLSNDSAMLLFTRWDVWSQWESLVKVAGFRIANMIVWDKMNHTAGDLKGNLSFQHELIILAIKGRFKLRSERRDCNLWSVPSQQSPPLHPTEKPVHLLERAVYNFTHLGDLVLDPFAGVGSTLLAAKNYGRQYLGIEIEMRYVKICEERLKQTILATTMSWVGA